VTAVRKHAFALQPGLFHDASGSRILNVAYVTDTPNARLTKSPIDDVRKYLRHDASPPGRSSQHVAESQTRRAWSPEIECAHELPVATPEQNIGSGGVAVVQARI
jgi:hypothetical protein